ncbi:hypothetical protein LguiA_009081 [Lonicera macranthoides]
MNGGFATQQGDCSSFKDPIPHCCKNDPTIADLTPDSSPENMSQDCCHSGVLAAWAINPLKSFTSFEITVGNLDNSTAYKPMNLTLLAPGPGYTCSSIVDTDPTVSSKHGNQHARTLALWRTKNQSVVLHSQHFTVQPSHHALHAAVGVMELTATQLALGDDLSQSSLTIGPNTVECTDHMCPLRIHWHVKSNYKDHWRVKLTVSNYNYGRNYTDWNVLVQHPVFSQSAKTFSFNSTVLSTVGVPDDVSLYWGSVNYNSELLQADEKQEGSVTTEILLGKDSNEFTFSNGWAFPRRIYFNGENCEMPLPDNFPMLPNGSSLQKPTNPHFLLVFLIYLTFKIPFEWF